jgi:hypothetical protein
MSSYIAVVLLVEDAEKVLQVDLPILHPWHTEGAVVELSGQIRACEGRGVDK